MVTHCSFPGCKNSYLKMKNMKKGDPGYFTMHYAPLNQKADFIKLFKMKHNICHVLICSVHFPDEAFYLKDSKRTLRKDVSLIKLLKQPSLPDESASSFSKAIEKLMCQPKIVVVKTAPEIVKTGRMSLNSSGQASAIKREPLSVLSSNSICIPDSSSSTEAPSSDEIIQLRKEVEMATARIKQLERDVERSQTESSETKNVQQKSEEKSDSDVLASQMETYEKELQQINDERIDLETANLVLQSKIESNQARIIELDQQFDKARKALVMLKSKIKYQEEIICKHEPQDSDTNSDQLGDIQKDQAENQSMISIRSLNQSGRASKKSIEASFKSTPPAKKLRFEDGLQQPLSKRASISALVK